MEKKKVIKLNIIIIMILVILIILDLIVFLVLLKKSGISMSNSEIKEIAEDYYYKIKDKQLERFYNDLLGKGTLIVSKETANTLEKAKNLSIEYKNKLNAGLANDFIVKTYKSHTDFEYINFIETDYYYKYIGEYSYKYSYTSNIINEGSQKYVFLVFKSDYFEYPYLKKYNDAYSVKEFGDILAVINYGDRKIIKSEVKENIGSFIYNLYYISMSSSGPDGYSGMAPTVIAKEHYSLEKATFKVNKSTGKTDLNISKCFYQECSDYKSSCNPYMNIEIIKSFSEDR